MELGNRYNLRVYYAPPSRPEGRRCCPGRGIAGVHLYFASLLVNKGYYRLLLVPTCYYRLLQDSIVTTVTDVTIFSTVTIVNTVTGETNACTLCLGLYYHVLCSQIPHFISCLNVYYQDKLSDSHILSDYKHFAHISIVRPENCLVGQRYTLQTWSRYNWVDFSKYWKYRRKHWEILSNTK